MCVPWDFRLARISDFQRIFWHKKTCWNWATPNPFLRSRDGWHLNFIQQKNRSSNFTQWLHLKKKVSRSLKITRLGFRKIVNSLITDPTNNGDKINDKTWDFTLEQSRIAKNDIDFMNAGNIILGNNWKKVKNWKFKEI